MRERLPPWLLVLPALVFALPLSPLAADPFPHLAGTGLAVVLLCNLEGVSAPLLDLARQVADTLLR